MNKYQPESLAFMMDNPLPGVPLLPGEHFTKLEKSRVHKRIDNKPVWSIPCFFIDKNFRRKGITVELLKGVIKYAKKPG